MTTPSRHIRHGFAAVRPYLHGHLDLADFGREVLGAVEIERVEVGQPRRLLLKSVFAAMLDAPRNLGGTNTLSAFVGNMGIMEQKPNHNPPCAFWAVSAIAAFAIHITAASAAAPTPRAAALNAEIDAKGAKEVQCYSAPADRCGHLAPSEAPIDLIENC
jgi:hypothetical protein